jgi:uncharacterized lipoprotein YmbA
MGGCSPLAPRPDYSKFFVLTPISDPSVPSAPVTSARPLAIGLGPVDFPDYLKRPQVVTRTSANELDFSPVDRWGEPLEVNFNRVLSENLSQLLGTSDIIDYPWSRRTDINYQVVINVQRFETDSNGQSQLRARWIIRDGTTGKDLYASQTVAAVSSPMDNAQSARALSSDLGSLSRDVANKIIQLHQQRTSLAISRRSG